MTGPRALVSVSWCMPPALFPRSIQVARLLKGLRPLGWHSTVVTPHIKSLPPADTIDPSLGELYGSAYDLVPVDLTRIDPETGPRMARWAQWARGEERLTDDELWVKRAATAAIAAAHDTRAAALVTFAQPWRDHLAGLEVTGALDHLPWIAHFSDPWVDSLYDADLPEEIQVEERRREALVIERADAVVFTNPYAADLVMAKYPKAWRTKAWVVPHAMDADLVPLAERLVSPAPAPRPMRVSHVGNLFVGRRTANRVFEALAVMNEKASLAGRLEVVLVGEGSGLYEARCRVFELALESVVTFRSRVSHIESLAAIQASDLLLLIDAPAETNVFMPSKVVDYVMMRRPILAITPSRGASADILGKLGHAIVAPGNVAAIVAEFERALQRFEAAGPPGPAPTDPALELSAVAPAFAAILDAVTRARG